MNSKPTPQPLVQHIQRIQVQPPPSPSAQIDGEMYTKAVKILRKVAPNLQTVTLIGSYMFKSANEVCFAKFIEFLNTKFQNRPDSIKEEVLFVRNYLKTVIYAFESQNITVEDVRFVVGIIVPDKVHFYL